MRIEEQPPAGPAAIPRSSPSFPLLAARIVSSIGHPLVVIPFGVAVSTGAWRWAALIAATTVIPLTIFILIQVRRGRWSNFDVSQPRQRRGLYLAIVPLLIAAIFALRASGASPDLVRGVFAGALMLAAGLLLSRWLKVSLHMMFGAFCAVNIVRVYPTALIPAIMILAAVAWSRLALRRHTVAEVAVGTAIGLAGAIL